MPVHRQWLLARVGELEVDEQRRELRGPAGSLAAQPKVFDLLVYLVRERDRVIPRDELLRAIWPEAIVGPDSVTRALGEVRRLLGRDVVRTYPAHGVRFVGPVIDLCAGAPRGAGVRDAERGLFGIADKLAAIDEILARAARDRGGIRLVIGPPGTGKSSLLEVAAQRAGAAGFEIVRASGALDAAVGDAMASRRPVLVVHDDLFRNGTATSIDADHLATMLAHAPVAVVAACCSSARRDARARAVLAAATRRDPDAIIRLDVLPPAALAALAEHVLGRKVSPAAITKLEALTGGNPRFARHVLHMAKQANRPLETLDALPASFADRVRELVLEHVHVLGPDARALLDGVSILEQPFTLDIAAAIARMPANRAVDALAEAGELGLVAEAGPGRWRFAHELVRTVIERALLPSERAGFHTRAATALERWLGTPLAQLERIASHYAAGVSAAHAPRAVELARRAGKLALESYAFGKATRWFETALDIEALVEPPSPLRRRALWLELAKVQVRGGQLERAAESFAAAEALSESARCEADAVRAALYAIVPALPRIVDRFFALLFARHPQTRSMFGRSSALQRRMFGEAIAALADHADDPAWLQTRLDALGRRHAEYGVTEEMYRWARDAFLDAITDALAPEQLASDVRETWARTFDAIAQTMIAAGVSIAAAASLPEPLEPPRASTR